MTSVAQSLAAEPTHPTGTRLLDHADVVLDLCTPPGDAMVVLEGTATPIGPGSTIAAVALVNEIKVQTAALLLERGALPPVLTSAALVGADESRACSTRPTPSTRAARAGCYVAPAGVPAPSHRGRYCCAKSSFATIVAAPITPACPSSSDRRTIRSRVASGRERR